MKKISFIQSVIIAVFVLLVVTICSLSVKLHEREVSFWRLRNNYIEDTTNLEAQRQASEALLDRIYEDNEDYFLDVLMETEVYNTYVELNK